MNSCPTSRSPFSGIFLSALLITALSTGRPETAGAAMSAQEADAPNRVECVVPGQVRRLGPDHLFLTPRRAVSLSAARCRARGGEITRLELDGDVPTSSR